MDVSKYKPGRRLDAMVAMALGWKWRGRCETGNIEKWRFLQKSYLPVSRRVKLLPLCEDARVGGVMRDIKAHRL